MSEAIKGGWPGVGGDFERRLGLGFRASAHAPSWFRIWFRVGGVSDFVALDLGASVYLV